MTQVDLKGTLWNQNVYANVIYFVWLFLAAAVDYLAKNVSLSTQRRMKLGEHSAVLGLLQVETGQAY